LSYFVIDDNVNTMSKKIDNIPIKRILLLLDYLEDLLKNNPNKATFDVEFKILAQRDPLLSDKKAVETSLKKIEGMANGSVTYEFYTMPASDTVSSHHDAPGSYKASFSTNQVYINDPAVIKKLRNDVLSDSETKSDQVDFVVTHEGNEAVIRIKGDGSGKECRLSLKPRRYRFLRYIIDAKKYVSTNVLVSEFKSDPKTKGVFDGEAVRREIDAIRKRFSDDLNIDSEKNVIENDPGVGYRFLNIEIKN